MEHSSEIKCVFQDCPLCGNRGKLLKKVIETHGLAVKKVSFASDEGRELIAKAVMDYGIGKLPFFTDGINFSTNIMDFVDKEEIVEKPVKKTAKKTKRTRKSKKGESE